MTWSCESLLPTLMPLLSIADSVELAARNTAHDSIEDIQVTNVLDSTISQLADVKVTNVDKTKGVDGSPVVESTRNASISTTADQTSDVASISSMPAVHVTEPTSPIRERPLTSPAEPSLLSTTDRPPPSPSRSNGLQGESTPSLSLGQRRARHRSAAEVCLTVSCSEFIFLTCCSQGRIVCLVSSQTSFTGENHLHQLHQGIQFERTLSPQNLL